MPQGDAFRSVDGQFDGAHVTVEFDGGRAGEGSALCANLEDAVICDEDYLCLQVQSGTFLEVQASTCQQQISKTFISHSGFLV